MVLAGNLDLHLANLQEALLPISLPVIARIYLALNKRLKTAYAVFSRAAKVQGLHPIVDEYSDRRVRTVAILSEIALALEPLHNHTPTKRNHLTDAPHPRVVGHGGIERLNGGLPVKPHCGEYGDHLVVVRKVGVDRAIERERFWRSVKRAVGLRVVANGCSGQTSEELIDVAYALNSAQSLAVAGLLSSYLKPPRLRRLKLTLSRSIYRGRPYTRNLPKRLLPYRRHHRMDLMCLLRTCRTGTN